MRTRREQRTAFYDAVQLLHRMVDTAPCPAGGWLPALAGVPAGQLRPLLADTAGITITALTLATGLAEAGLAADPHGTELTVRRPADDAIHQVLRFCAEQAAIARFGGGW